QGQNKQDPQDMVVGTTGLGAGMVTMISLMPLPDELKSEDEEEDIHRRQLYVHGRYTVEKHLLIQRGNDGCWSAVGTIQDEVMTKDQGKYFEALLRIGAQEKFVTAEEISKAVGTRPITVHKVLSRIRYAGKAYRGW